MNVTHDTRRDERLLRQSLAPRMEVEKRFAEMGHTYRHGPFYRKFEHFVTRPLLRAFLRSTGLYARGARNALRPVVRNLRIPLAGLPPDLHGFRILHLSDFHIDGTPELADALVPMLRGLRPDLCLLTGDYRYEDHGPTESVYPLMRKILSNIDATFGTFAILGNHDSSEIAFRLEEMNVRMLVNEGVEIGRFSRPLWVAGVDDPFDFRCHDLARGLAQAPAGSISILMAHAPEIFEEAAAAGVHLYLAGHTHAGQIRFPGIGALRQNANCPKEFGFGHWRHGEMQGHTSAGLGCSSLPVRFNCPPEIALLELRASD